MIIIVFIYLIRFFQNLKALYVKFLAAIAEVGKDTIEKTRYWPTEL